MLSRLESGEQKDISLVNAAKICAALGLSLEDLAGAMQGRTMEIPEPRFDPSEIGR